MRLRLDIYFLEIFNLDETCGPQDECKIELFHLKICARKRLVGCTKVKYHNIFLGGWKGHPVLRVLDEYCMRTLWLS